MLLTATRCSTATSHVYGSCRAKRRIGNDGREERSSPAALPRWVKIRRKVNARRVREEVQPYDKCLCLWVLLLLLVTRRVHSMPYTASAPVFRSTTLVCCTEGEEYSAANIAAKWVLLLFGEYELLSTKMKPSLWVTRTKSSLTWPKNTAKKIVKLSFSLSIRLQTQAASDDVDDL